METILSNYLAIPFTLEFIQETERFNNYYHGVIDEAKQKKKEKKKKEKDVEDLIEMEQNENEDER